MPVGDAVAARAAPADDEHGIPSEVEHREGDAEDHEAGQPAAPPVRRADRTDSVDAELPG